MYQIWFVITNSSQWYGSFIFWKSFFAFYQVKLVNTIRIFRVVSLFNFQCSLLYISNKFQYIEILFSNVSISCTAFRHLSVVCDSLSSLSCCFFVVKYFFQTFFISNLCFLYLSEATVISYNIFRRLSTCFFIIFWVVLILTFFRIVCSFSTTH